MNIKRTMAVAALVAATLPAQTSRRVGPNGFATIQAAIDASDSGDEILVAAGVYDEFSVGKELTIRADPAGSVSVMNLGNPGATSPVFVAGTSFARVRIVGMSLPSIIGNYTSLTLEDCVIRASSTSILTTLCNVHLERCDLVGASFSGSKVSMVDSRIAAVDAALATIPMAPAIELSGCEMVASGLRIDPAVVGLPAPLIVAGAGSPVRLSDTVFTPFSTVSNICPVDAPDTIYSRCTFNATCALLQQAPVLGATGSGPLTAGSAWTASFQGEPNEPLLVLANSELGYARPAILAEPLLLQQSGLVIGAAVATDSSGAASVTWTLPAAPLPPGIGLWCQGVSGTTLPLRASPPIGGIAR